MLYEIRNSNLLALQYFTVYVFISYYDFSVSQKVAVGLIIRGGGGCIIVWKSALSVNIRKTQ